MTILLVGTMVAGQTNSCTVGAGDEHLSFLCCDGSLFLVSYCAIVQGSTPLIAILCCKLPGVRV